ncbi:NADH:flavin oxidoreductase [Arthrobacter sp. OY3WO11]|uniref:oxidoreductase n=1 Tax=Arthrobacter sp. OY3WO11 TaxID=1835723 RepID=UPI0007CF801A|nr:NADH:flavin oxidoreductase [Arthrobacter sp. OY3WO11]OAD97711.1 NADH:flavin oxidoreductase [Arthrobacter sp. OY3WO11]
MPNLDPLWTSLRIGSTELPNRVALAPMTRVSATEDGHATERMASYYSRFAAGDFGLLITEGIYTDTVHSQGYLFQPGLATAEQAESWVKVVDAVHARGARIFAQLMHAGAQSQGNRFVNSSLGPSTVAPKGEQLGFYRGEGPYREPQEATAAQLDEVREGFVNAALNAKAAGFDGVEIHGANGYLLDQFLADYLNQRTDQYGGTTENRVRLAAEVSRAVRDAVGPDMSVGIRISQGKVSDHTHKWAGGADEAKAIFTALAATGIDYIHTTEYRAEAPAFGEEGDSLAALAKQHTGLTVIANGSLDEPEAAAALIADGQADVIALGKAALATRDWPRRARSNDSLDELDGSVFAPVADVKDWELEQTA